MLNDSGWSRRNHADWYPVLTVPPVGSGLHTTSPQGVPADKHRNLLKHPP